MWIERVLMMLLLVGLAVGWRCVHDEIEQGEVMLVETSLSHVYEKREVEEEVRFDMALKIHTDMSNLYGDKFSCYKEGDVVVKRLTEEEYVCEKEDVMTEEKIRFLRGMLEDAYDFFEDVLRIKNFEGPFKILSGENHEERCSNIVIDSRYEDPGLEDVGFIMFVTTRPIDKSSGALAYASYCQAEYLADSTGQKYEARPLVGVINVAPRSLSLRRNNYRSQKALIIHEMTHSLGFTKSKFLTGFINWTSNTEFVHIDRTQLQETLTFDGVGEVTRIITPRVQKAVRLHYGCDTLNGAEIERRGSSGTTGSHWSERTFFNEYMTGSLSLFPVFSQITMALLEDMGYYRVNYESKEINSLSWGFQMGCSFVNETCHAWPKTSEVQGLRCDHNSPQYQLLFDLTGYGVCNIDITNDKNSLSDGCTYYIPTANSLCNQDSTEYSFLFPAAEHFSDNSRCFTSNILKTGVGSIFALGQFPGYRCYETDCTSRTNLKVRVDDIWYDCPYQGGFIHPIGYGGRIECIPQAADRVCSQDRFDPYWPQFHNIVPHRLNEGDNATVYGRNFLATDNITVYIHDKKAKHLIVSDTEIQITVPHYVSSLIEGGSYLSRRKTIVIRDDIGRTAVKQHRIILLDDIFQKQLFATANQLTETPSMLSLSIIFTITLSTVAVISLVIKRRKKEKAEREASDQEKLFELIETLDSNDHSITV